ncbi:Mek1 [Kluyveromyces lactis]|nr:Mek1 [Kluyveromyces lactis]
MDKVLGVLEVDLESELDSSPQFIINHFQIEINKVLKLGRNTEECVYSVEHPSVSNIHCVLWGIRFDPESVPLCYIKDMSLNGTMVNGQVLSRDVPYLLSNQDVIQLPNGAKFKFSAVKSETMSQFMTGLRIKSEWDRWKIVPRIVGSGTFGHVLVAEKLDHNMKKQVVKKTVSYAVKVINTAKTRMVKEATILEKLNHPNIIRIHQSCTDALGNVYIFQDLISGGDLFSYLAKGDCLVPISETESLIIIYQILLALKFLHSNGIVHRDLKLDNILLHTPEPCTKVVLADFGIAKELSQSTKERMHTVVGTPEYCAPEVGFKADRNIYRSFSRTATLDPDNNGYDSKCDIWSLGVITHIMLTGISPFYGDGSEASIIKNVRTGKLNFTARQWIAITDSAKSFVKKCLQVSTFNRCDVEEALHQVWVEKHTSQLERIYKKKVLQLSSDCIKIDENIDTFAVVKHKLPKSVKLSPEKNPNKRLKLFSNNM